MAFSSKAGMFSKDTGAAPATQAITGVGFQPKAIIFYMTGGITLGTFSANPRLSYGFAVGTAVADQGSVAASELDNVATTVSKSLVQQADGSSNPTCIAIINSSGTKVAEAELRSFDSDGFTIRWNTNNASAFKIGYLALGGTDLTNTKVVNWQHATSTGDKAVTGVGFKPDCVIHIDAGQVATTLGTVGDSLIFDLGWMTPVNQAATGLVGLNGLGTTAQARGQSNAAALFSPSSIGVSHKASFVSMDSDGFTVNYSTASPAAGQILSLCFKGGSYKAGTVVKTTDAATASQATTGTGFVPTGLLFQSTADTTADGVNGGGRLTVGGTSGSGVEATIAYQSQNSTSPSRTRAVSKDDKMFLKANNDTSTVDAEADLTSFDADGFTASWTTNDAVGTRYFYLSTGSTVSKTASVSDSITITESAKATLVHNIAVSDSITITESVGRRLDSNRSVSDSITITENTAVVLSDPNIEVSDSITVSESIQLLLQSFVSVSDSVTITESVNQLLTSFVTVSDSVTITESSAAFTSIGLTVSDTITITESVSVLIPTLFITVNDSITITENVSVSIEAPGGSVSTSDTITISEEMSRYTDLIAVREEVTVEIVAGIPERNITVSDNITITENIGKLITELFIRIVENRLQDEAGNFILDESGNFIYDENQPTELITVSESLGLTQIHNITKSDTITITESITRLRTSFISKSETITITENVSLFSATLGPKVSDTITVSESVVMSQPANPTYTITVNLSNNIVTITDLANTITVTVPESIIRADLSPGTTTVRIL